MINKVYEMIEKLLNDEYDAMPFSCDVPDFIFDNYEAIESECYEVARLLDDDWQDIFDIVEYEDDKPRLKELVKEGYKTLLEIYPKQ